MEGMVLGCIKKGLEDNLIVYLEPRGECGIYKLNSKSDLMGIDIFDKIRFKESNGKICEIEKLGFSGIKNIMSDMTFRNQRLKFMSSKVNKHMIILVEKSKKIYKEGNAYILEFNYKGSIERCKISDSTIENYLMITIKNLEILNEYIKDSYMILVLQEIRDHNEIVKIQNIKMVTYK